MSEALKEKVKTAVEHGDIAALYVMEQEAYETFDEQTLSAFYANILDLAMENLTNALESARRMDIAEVQDFATLRALYEYAMEHYSEGKRSDASALFEILSGLCEEKRFSEAMKCHMEAVNDGLGLDDFIEKRADIEKTEQNGTFYISACR